MLYPYEVLGIPEDADQEQVRKAYLNKIRLYPPEKEPEKFSQVVSANELIKDELSRARLKLFGLNGISCNTRFTELVIKTDKKRNKIGIDTWLLLLQADEE